MGEAEAEAEEGTSHLFGEREMAASDSGTINTRRQNNSPHLGLTRLTACVSFE